MSLPLVIRVGPRGGFPHEIGGLGGGALSKLHKVARKILEDIPRQAYLKKLFLILDLR